MADAFEADVAAQDGHGFKERRRVFASADGDADGLEHGTGLEAERRGGCAQSLLQRIVVEGGCRRDLLGVLKDPAGQGGIALLRDQLGGVVGRELVDEEEVGGGDGFAEQLDALADERRDGAELFGRGMEAGLLEEGLKLAAELVDGQGADVLAR